MQRSTAHFDSESLQADVMRFMAIIAFCLIAILALVKSVDTPPTPLESVVVERTAISEEPRVAETSQPLETSEPAPRDIELTTPEQPPAAPEVWVVAAAGERPVELEAAPMANAPVLDQRPSATSDESPSELEETSPRADADEGLYLRFKSDADFMRLISRGDVALFAFNDQGVLGLGRDYKFREVRPPGQVYEIAPDTIPAFIAQAFASDPRARPRAVYSWGVRLPQRIESQIKHFIDEVETGVLLIDRYGEVRHVGTS